MKKKVILVIIWMIVIFMFSNQSANVSTGQSNVIVNALMNLFGNIPNLSFIVRKCAHFTEYLILGLLVYNMIRCTEFKLKDMLLISILICSMYATSDEIHQLFIDGRSCQVFDVLIDTMGSLSGIIIYKLSKERIVRK